MPIFTSQNVINAIGGPDRVSEICIDKGGNFLEGKVTTGFQKIMTTNESTWVVTTKVEGNIDVVKRFDNKEEAINYKNEQESNLQKNNKIAELKNKPTKQYSVIIEEGTLDGSLVNIGSTAANVFGMAATLSVGPEIISALTNEVANVTADQLSSITAKIVEAPISAALEAPKKMKEQMQKTFDEEKTTLAKELKKFNINAEERLEQQQTEAEQANENSYKEKLNEKVASLHTTMAKATTAMNDKVVSIAKYMAEGPDWVADQISQTIEDTMSQLNKNVDNICDNIKSGVNGFAESQGKAAGHALANQYNKIIEEQAKKTYNAIEENKSKAKIKSFAALQKAKLKIMALTGVNIPV